MISEPIQFTILKGPCRLREQPADLVIVLCQQGGLTLRDAGAPAPASTPVESRAEQGDLILVNAMSTYELSADEGMRAIRFELDHARLRTCLPRPSMRFSCNSTVETNDSVRLLRSYLEEAVVCRYEQAPTFRAELNRLFYQIASLLIARFPVAEAPVEEADRIQGIIMFIESHYAERLSLERMGAEFGLTPQYFSKYFKAQFGMTFHEYLRAIRLSHAEEDLEQTDDSLLRIALDNGFPNAESFRQAFVEAYGVTPAEHRARSRAETAAHGPDSGSLEEAVLLLDDATFAKRRGEELASVDVTRGRTYAPFWRDAFSLDSIRALDRHEVRERLGGFQRDLSFTCIRFQLTEESMRRIVQSPPDAFLPEDHLFDDLFSLELRPWVVLPFRAEVPAESYAACLDNLIAHFSNRYDIAEVRTWRFELSAGSRLHGNRGAFERCLGAMARTLERFGCGDALFAADISLSDWGALDEWAAFSLRDDLPRVRSTYRAEPQTLVTLPSGESARKLSDSSYINDCFFALERRYATFEGCSTESYVINGGEDSPASPLYDSCYFGALTVKNLIDSFGRIGAFIPANPFDDLDEAAPQNHLLFGGAGFLTRGGIPKPSYFAYELMGGAGPAYLSKGDHHIVFSKGRTSYQVICHNCKRLSASYYTTGADAAQIGTSPANLFEDDERLIITVRLAGVMDGAYTIKMRSVSEREGSVADELRRMYELEPSNMQPAEFDHLTRVSTPRVSSMEREARGGVLEFPITLDANEFAEVDVVYRF